MAKKSKKKGLSSKVVLIISTAIFVIGLICFFAIYGAAGVTSINVVKTNALGKETSTTTTLMFAGLAALFGGDAKVSMSVSSTVEALNKGTTDLGTLTLTFNYGTFIALMLVLVGFVLFVATYKNKLCQLVSTLLLVSGTIVLFCSGAIFAGINADTVEPFIKLHSAIGQQTTIDIGSMILGISSGLIGVFNLFHLVLLLAKGK